MTLIVDMLNELIKGKTAVQQRITVFERVRNIPYRLIPALYSLDLAPHGILLANAGSCTPKHFLLGQWFKLLKYDIKYVTYIYDWTDSDPQFPSKLGALAESYPEEYHLALKVLIEEQWTLVDATWDPFLQHFGFAVNLKWDGFSDTRNAVNQIDSIEHDGPESRVKYACMKRENRSDDEKMTVDRFTICFNQWLDACRYINHLKD